MSLTAAEALAANSNIGEVEYVLALQGDCAVKLSFKVYTDSKKILRTVSKLVLVEDFSFKLY